MGTPSGQDDKKLNELERDADLLLSQIEAREKSSANDDSALLQPEDAEWFRDGSTGWQSRKDFEWSHHPFLMRLLAPLAALWISMLFIDLPFRPPPPVGTYHLVTGTVVACGVISISSVRGANRVIATITAPDGQLVQVPVISGTPLEKGMKVPLREYANHRYLLDHPL